MHKYIPNALDANCVETLIQSVTGGNVEACHVVDAAYHVLGYTLGQVVPCDHPVPPTVGSEADKVALLEKVKAHAKPGVKAVDVPWLMVWSLVKQIIDNYLANKLGV